MAEMSLARAKEYEYIHVHCVGKSKSGKTGVYTVHANRDDLELGGIKWFGRWRQYTFFPSSQTVFSTGCLADVAETLDVLNRIQKSDHLPATW